MSRDILPGAPPLSYSTVCPQCGKTYISVLRDFPANYVCLDCLGPEAFARAEYHRVWMAEHQRCERGHVLTEATVYVHPRGGHYCRKCVLEKQADYRKRVRRPG